MPLSKADFESEEVKQMLSDWKEYFKKRINTKTRAKEKDLDLSDCKPIQMLEADDTTEWEQYDQHYPRDLGYDYPEGQAGDGKEPLPPIIDVDQMEDKLDMDFDRYISAKVKLPHNGVSFANGIVLKRSRDKDGKLVGRHHNNPLLDNTEYDVLMEDGAVERYTANTIAEHIYSQIDGDGYERTLLDEILEHKKGPEAVSKEDGWFKTKSGKLSRKLTTVGWEFLVKFKDRSEQWIKLKDLKEANPIELAEYAKANGIMDEPALAWWAPKFLSGRTRIIKAMKKRYFRTTQKFGIEVPKTVQRALEIDRETGTTFWRDAIKKEMNTVAVAFDILEEGKHVPVGSKHIGVHLVFDVKQGTLQRKARLVCDGSKSEPDVPCYAGVVSRESVRIAFMYAALNDLDLCAADCEGAYLNAPPREKLHTTCGPEFGENQGKTAVIVRALYGAKSSAASWRAAISDVIENLGFKMCQADNDVWLRPALNKHGEECYEYILVYSDDLLTVAQDPKAILGMICQHFQLKEDSVKEPTQYLGADIVKVNLHGGLWVWGMRPDTYQAAAIANVEAWLEKKSDSARLKTKVSSMLPTDWKPELDVSEELDSETGSYYQQQVGVLRWLVELGRWDIVREVSALAAHSALPREGHLGGVLHLFAYLKQYPNCELAFDPTPMDWEQPKACDWSDFYRTEGAALEENPLKPKPRGKAVQTTAMVDSDHAGDYLTRRSRTGVVIFVMSAPIVIYSKKQGSIETASFGSELSAAKTATELVEGLRYKLVMMGIPLDGPTHLKIDNMSVVHNCSNPASQLKKKSNSVAYHYVRERCAWGVLYASYINTKQNLADTLTKCQTVKVRQELCSGFMRYVRKAVDAVGNSLRPLLARVS